MALIDDQLSEVWKSLRSQFAQRSNMLSEVRIRNLRGIRDLRVPFSYPVSVLAGPNGCGKSTVLFASACAYKVPGAGTRVFVPSALFPNFTGGGTNLKDEQEGTEIEFHYLDNGERTAMMWRRGKAWGRNFMGRRGGKQPEGQLYLRTLANLTNPSEVRSILHLARRDPQAEEVTEDLLLFAYRILPRRYLKLSSITSQTKDKDLLFAELGLKEGIEARYSEFHMSAGERAILRISREISRLQNAIILIDEIEAGLHPYTQKKVMLELQRLALRNNLQIIVASHSPVVLESVPEDARIFLDRDEETAEVKRVEAYRDIIQKALYGQSNNTLSILCEDKVAEGVIRGFMDILNPKLEIGHDDIMISSDTGKNEFIGHIRTLSKIEKIDDFLFVLDGDARDLEVDYKNTASKYGQRVEPLFLPGDSSPEKWIWDKLKAESEAYAKGLGITESYLIVNLREIDQMLQGSLDKLDPAKHALDSLSDILSRPAEDIARVVARREAEKSQGSVAVFLASLEDQITAWRQS